jgi:hypothetical protein
MPKLGYWLVTQRTMENSVTVEQIAEQKKAYQACLDMAQKNNWRGCYNAMAEDGFDPNVDWCKMYKEWCEENK